MNTLLKTLLTTSLLAVAGSACAHAVWLERDAKGVHLYYGEYDEAKREPSPGRLDDLGTPQAFVQGAPVVGQKGAQGWSFGTASKVAPRPPKARSATGASRASASSSRCSLPATRMALRRRSRPRSWIWCRPARQASSSCS